MNTKEIIDKLRTEFQKRFEICQKVSEDERNALDTQDWYRGKSTAYSEVLSFLNMLEKESPFSVDLDEAVKESWADYDELYNWPSSLRNHPKLSDSWKPSEEQMEALEKAKEIIHNPATIQEANKIFYNLEHLIIDLRKLM